MANTIDIRRRIRSVKNTQQITKAMKMVAAARLRRAQERTLAARPYSAALQKVLASLATRVDLESHPLLQQRDEKNVLLVVVTGDRGLAGAFNANVIKAALNAIKDHNWESVQLVPIGRKANDFFKRRSIPIRRASTQIFQALSFDTAREIATEISNDFISGEIDAVYVAYNEFKSIIAQIVKVDRLLPIEKNWEQAENAVDYLYEPGPDQILVRTGATPSMTRPPSTCATAATSEVARRRRCATIAPTSTPISYLDSATWRWRRSPRSRSSAGGRG
jgi:F-type H+-transporting ATPase subunit gamma